VDQVLEALSRGLTQKLLHGTLAELRSSEGEHRHELAETVSRLFLRSTARNPSDDGR
jgi:glutamyl-tRNA reductase